MGASSASDPVAPSQSGAGTANCDALAPGCPTCKLVSLTVIKNATQTNVSGDKHWACVKKSSDDVIVQATTDPNTADCWNKINWSGDVGSAVPGKPNQRKLSRDSSRRWHVFAELGGGTDQVVVWILWAEVTILTSGTRPANAAKFSDRFTDPDDKDAASDVLGAMVYDNGNSGVGKVVPVAQLMPSGVGVAVTAGWEFPREVMSHTWMDGRKYKPGETSSDYWNTTRVDDTSRPKWLRLTPDANNKIYDLDAPSVVRQPETGRTFEVYDNFWQWVEWNGERCSDEAPWYWRGIWNGDNRKAVIELTEVGTGSPALPEKPKYP
jgi:hypothetical protein